MKTPFIVLALLMGAIWMFSPAACAGDTLLGGTAFAGAVDKAAKETTVKAEAGIQFRYEDREVPDAAGEHDGSAGWFYGQAEIETGSVNGFQVGLGGVAVQRLWAKGRFDNAIAGDEVFEDHVFLDRHDAYWTEGYLRYTVPDRKTSFILGRADDGKFGEPASGDGDYYQGFGVTVKEIPGLTIRSHVVNAWTNDASAGWDFDGIQENWEKLEDEDGFANTVNREASDWAFTLMVDWEVIKDVLVVTPYTQHQGDVGTSFGIEMKAGSKMSDSVALGIAGAYARFYEDTPDDLWPDDRDMSQYIINPYVLYSANKWKFKFGGGYYTISNDIPPFNSIGEGGDDLEDLFIWDEFDPMGEDIAKYGEQQNNKTYFLQAGIGYRPFGLEIIYGWVDSAVVEDGWLYQGEGSELDVYLSVDITDAIGLELIYCDLDDDFSGPTDIAGKTDPNRSFRLVGGGFRYKF